jgi:outer membrane cobalamin receptor
MKFDQIVVTGTSTAKSKMKQSVSVSTMDAEQMEKSGATSAAELLRAVPGVRSESSGGEGNANITVRGVPLSAGGSRYVQLQEDGLPLVLFGDVSFGTADQFLRADFNVDRLEVIRGGSASTLATNSPGGIVNFISKTGTEAGGSAALTAGLQQRQTRLDVDYGGSLGPRTTFHIGGFQRTGEGGVALHLEGVAHDARHAGQEGLNGVCERGGGWRGGCCSRDEKERGLCAGEGGGAGGGRGGRGGRGG